jgi:SAM-dependent methyltransferase
VSAALLKTMLQPPFNHWDALSDGYRDKVLTPFANQHSTELFLSLLPSDTSAGSILDAGCGNGYFLRSLLDKFAPAEIPVALDSSERMLAHASRKLGPSVFLIRAGIDDMPLSDNSFDRVFAVNSLLSDKRTQREKCFRELHRILHPQGRLVVLLPALESYWEQLHVAREQFIADGMDEQQAIWEVYHPLNDRMFDPIGGYINILDSPLRIKLYTHWEIERFLGSAGFIDITITRYRYSREHCVHCGLFCSDNGLFDWFVSAGKQA